jgi:signal peptidase I
VIAIPGDTVEMRNNVVFINGQPLTYTRPDPKCKEHLSDKLKDRSQFATEDLDSISHTVMSTPSVRAMRSFGPVTVPQGHYFVMGDNRDNSRDSRIFGLVERVAIVGKAKRVIISFNITDKYQPRFKRFLDPLQ